MKPDYQGSMNFAKLMKIKAKMNRRSAPKSKSFARYQRSSAMDLMLRDVAKAVVKRVEGPTHTCFPMKIALPYPTMQKQVELLNRKEITPKNHRPKNVK